MSNKIKTVFRCKNLILENNRKYEYRFLNESNREVLYSIKLPEGVSLNETNSKKGLQILVGKEDLSKKELRKKLGFFSNLLKDKLKIKQRLITRKIFLIGTGFKVFNSKLNRGNELIFKIGFSHLVKIVIPQGIEFDIIKLNEIKFFSYDKELIGSFLNFVASMRFPDSYKGRGLLISNKPKVKLKKGKVKS
jgi:ribosomal protein L6P/L9E